MKRIYLFLLILIFSITNLTFADSRKVLQPVEEISRFLSLPRKNWEVSPGILVDTLKVKYLEENNTYRNMDIIDPITFSHLKVPFIPIGDRFEFYLLNPGIKFHILKNTRIENGELIAQNTNISISAGVRVDLDFTFRTYELSFQQKSILNEKLWWSTNGSFIINTDSYWETHVTSGLGIQFSSHFSMFIAGGVSRNEEIIYHETESVITPVVKVLIPIDFKLNFNTRHSILFYIELNHITEVYNWKNANWDTPFISGIPIGFKYSFTW